MEEQVRRLAYELWERAGWPNGQALEHYYQARRLLLREDTSAGALPTDACSLTSGGKQGSGGAMKRILLVEDSLAVLNILRFAFELAGFEVATATSGRAAVNKAVEENPDLIVTDLDLQDIDPKVLLPQLRRLPDREEARPVIVTTGMESRQAAAVVAAQDIVLLFKPFDVWDLVARVQRELMRTAGPRS